MGIFSDFKRLFFVKKAVVKSAGEKAVDRSKEAVDDLKEEASEAWDRAVAGTDKLADKVNDALDLDEAVARAKSFTEKMRSKVEGKDANDSTKSQDESDPSLTYHEGNQSEIQDNAGTQDQLEDKADKFAERAKEISEKLGNKALDLGEDAVEKAKDIARKIERKIDETVDKANKLAEEEARDRTEGSHAKTRHDENPNLTDSMLSGKDSFFEKAERFASNEPLEKEDPVIKKGDKTQSNKTSNKAYGFDDMDGDGNEIVDDAILDDENEEEKEK